MTPEISRIISIYGGVPFRHRQEGRGGKTFFQDPHLLSGHLGIHWPGFSVLVGPEVLAIMMTPRFNRAWTVVPMVVLSYILYGIKIALAWGSIYGTSLLVGMPNVRLSAVLKLFFLGIYPLFLHAFPFFAEEELA